MYLTPFRKTTLVVNWTEYVCTSQCTHSSGNLKITKNWLWLFSQLGFQLKSKKRSANFYIFPKFSKKFPCKLLKMLPQTSLNFFFFQKFYSKFTKNLFYILSGFSRHYLTNFFQFFLKFFLHFLKTVLKVLMICTLAVQK